MSNDFSVHEPDDDGSCACGETHNLSIDDSDTAFVVLDGPYILGASMEQVSAMNSDGYHEIPFLALHFQGRAMGRNKGVEDRQKVVVLIPPDLAPEVLRVLPISGLKILKEWARHFSPNADGSLN
jgi:hypothetical protein